MDYTDHEWLKTKYQDEGLTQEQISEMCDVSRSTITRWISKHGIESRSTGVSQAEGEYKDKSWLHEKYVSEKRSMQDIADEFGVSKETVKYWIEKHDIPKRNHSDAAKIRVESHPHTVPDNEKLHPTVYDRRGYNIVKCGVDDSHVGLHRLLATLLVDDLSELDGKHVHHKNGVPWDNRLENLEVLSISEHTATHHAQGDM